MNVWFTNYLGSFLKMNKAHSYIVFLLFSLSMIVSTPGAADRTYGPVKNNDYLSKIVKKSYPQTTLTRDQLMIGILRANYDSFRGGNVHFLKVGEKLILPDEDVVSQISKDEATRTVKEHFVFFKRGRPGTFPAVPLPEVPTEESADTVEAESKVNAESEGNDEGVVGEKATLDPVEESVASAEKEVEESRTKLENLESEKTQQDKVLQSLEMQIKKLEDELQSTSVSDEEKLRETDASSAEDVINEEPESSHNANNDTDSLEESTISALESNISSGKENEAEVKGASSETSEEDVAESVEPAPQTPAVEEQKSNAVEENVFVEEKTKEESTPQIAPKEVPETPATESSFMDSSVPWWVWIIPLILVPLLILGLIFKSKDRVSSTDLPQVKKPKKKSVVKGVPHVNASEPVIRTSATVVESDEDADKQVSSQASHGASSATEKEVSLKIDMARAYLDMDYHDAAVEILKEVVEEGNAVQVERAREILARV